MRFKLKCGQHIQANPDWSDEAAEKDPSLKKSLTFNADGSGDGNVIETDTDLIKLLGDNGKFVRLGDRKGAKAPAKMTNPAHKGTVPTPGLASGPDDEEEIEGEDDEALLKGSKSPTTESELNHMTVAQLKEYAADKEIDLKGASSKSAIVAAILAKD